MRIREPWPRARTRQRRREFAAVFDGVPRHALGEALEIGAGDGFLSSLLAPYCRTLVTTDSYRPRLADGDEGAGALRRLVCDATALPFQNASFDFIFSSSVLEHVADRPRALAEMDRCLRPGGIMLHIMPSRTWKLLQVLFYYPHLLLGALDLGLERIPLGRRASQSSLPTLSTLPTPEGAAAAAPTLAAAPASGAAPAAIGDRWSDRRNWRMSLRTVLHGALPRVHGEFPGHLSEWRAFGAPAWAAEFRAAGFDVHRILLLPLYSGYGFGLERLRRFGERARLSSHNAFVVTKKASAAGAPASLEWFRAAPAPALAESITSPP